MVEPFEDLHVKWQDNLSQRGDPEEATMLLRESELLRLLAGPDAVLSPDEASTMFLNATAQNVTSIQTHTRWYPYAAAAAAVLLTLVAVLVWQMNADQDLYDGIKAAGPPVGQSKAQLRLFRGVHRNSTATVEHELLEKATIAVGDAVLFRYHTKQPAYITLFVEADEGVSKLWSSPHKVPAGERELVVEGQTMAYMPRAGKARFALITTLKASHAVPKTLNNDDLNDVCPRDECAFDTKEIVCEP